MSDPVGLVFTILCGLIINVKASGLFFRAIRLDAQPMQIINDPPGEFVGRSFGIRIIQSQNEGAILLLGKQPVVQRGANIADMQPTGWGWCKANDGGRSFGHGAAVNQLAAKLNDLDFLSPLLIATRCNRQRNDS